MSATLTNLKNYEIVSLLQYGTVYQLVNNGEEYQQIQADMAKIWANYERKCDQCSCCTSTKLKLEWT